MKKRLVNFDILRCMLMVMITSGHFITHGMKFTSVESDFCFNLSEPMGCMNFIISQSIYNIVIIAVNCFVFMTGFFMINDTTLRVGRLVRLWLEILFYSLGITFIFYFTNNISIITLFKCVIPIKSSIYWFMTNYFALSFLAPFISKLAKDISKTHYHILLGVLGFITTEMYKIPYGYTYGNIFGTSLLFFVFLYLIGGYFRRFGFFFKNYQGIILVSWIICIFLYKSYANIYYINGSYHGIVSSFPYHSWTLITSILFFQWYVKQKEHTDPISNIASKIAPYTLAVYLIQEHPLLRDILWREWIKLNHDILNSFYYLVLYISIPLIIFSLCLLMDYIRCIIFKTFKIDLFIKRFKSLTL